MALLFLSSPF
jgi:hypothetical protein